MNVYFYWGSFILIGSVFIIIFVVVFAELIIVLIFCCLANLNFLIILFKLSTFYVLYLNMC